MLFQLRLILKEPKPGSNPLFGDDVGVIIADNIDQAVAKIGGKIIPIPERFAKIFSSPGFTKLGLSPTWVELPDPRFYCTVSQILEISTPEDVKEVGEHAIAIAKVREEALAEKYK